MDRVEIPAIPDSPKLFLIQVEYYRIMCDTEKITGNKEFNETLTSV